VELTGKVAIVTGAGSGIGRATAILLSDRGAKVVLVGRRLEGLKSTLSCLNQNSEGALVVQTDVSKESEVRRLIEETIRVFGRLDILVNNAGVEGPYKTVPETSEDEWNDVIDINLKGVFLCSKFAIPAMRKSRHSVITNVSSNWGIVGAGSSAAYCASKAGVILLTKAMAIDHASDGIVVNCVCPGDVDTPMTQRSLKSYPESESQRPNETKLISPAEIAHAILYLVSEKAAMTTGSALVIDNGATAGEGPALLTSRKT
jgi:NAD(P)-dependent dehydrogenase (short-subunit alcohol dehydrogenase family)